MSSPPPSTRDEILAHAAAGRVHMLVQAASRYLLNQPDDAEIALLLIQAYAAVGLGGPARELLTRYSEALDQAGADVASLRQSVTKTPIGRVPWEQLLPTLESNMTRLVQHGACTPELAERGRQQCAAFQMYRSNDGGLHLSSKSAGAVRQWVSGFHDHRQLDHITLPANHSGVTQLICGLLPNVMIERVLAQTDHGLNGQRPAVHVIEPEPVRLIAWLCAADRSHALATRRLILHIGDTATDRFEQLLMSEDDLALPTSIINCLPHIEMSATIRSIQQRVSAHRQSHYAASCQHIAQRGSDRDAAYYLQRLNAGCGARILGLTSRFTTMLCHSMRDIGETLTDLGYEFHLSMESEDHRVHTSQTIARVVKDFDPDLIIMINHLRREQPQALGTVPVLTWIQDPVEQVLSREAGSSIGPMDFVTGYYIERCIEEFGYPASQCYSNWFFPVSERTFGSKPQIRPTHGQACDLAYVGHCPGTPDAIRNDARKRYPSHLHPMLDALHEKMLQRAQTGDVPSLREREAMVAEMARLHGVNLNADAIVNLANFYAYRIFDVAWRQQTLQWAARWAAAGNGSLRLYGNGWDAIPLFQPFACGPVKHGEALRQVYAQARLTLQTIPSGFIHQRSFEALLSGSLVIARHSPQDYDATRKTDGTVHCAQRYFPELDRIVFRDEQEFDSLATALLADDELRQDLTERFRSIITASFTYEVALPKIMAHICDAMQRHATPAMALQEG